METIFLWLAFLYLFVALLTGIEVTIYVLYLVEDIARHITVHLSLLVVGFERIALYHKKGVVVKGCYLCCLPRQHIHVYVSVPLCYYYWLAAFHLVQTVKHYDYTPVRLLASTANIHNNKITVGDFFFIINVGLRPYPQQALLVFFEAEVAKCVLAFVAIGIHIANILRCLAALLELLHIVFVEHSCSTMNKGFNIITGVLTRHVAMICVLATLQYVPVDCFEGCALLPQPP